MLKAGVDVYGKLNEGVQITLLPRPRKPRLTSPLQALLTALVPRGIIRLNPSKPALIPRATCVLQRLCRSSSCLTIPSRIVE